MQQMLCEGGEVERPRCQHQQAAPQPVEPAAPFTGQAELTKQASVGDGHSTARRPPLPQPVWDRQHFLQVITTLVQHSAAQSAAWRTFGEQRRPALTPADSLVGSGRGQWDEAWWQQYRKWGDCPQQRQVW